MESQAEVKVVAQVANPETYNNTGLALLYLLLSGDRKTKGKEQMIRCVFVVFYGRAYSTSESKTFFA